MITGITQQQYHEAVRSEVSDQDLSKSARAIIHNVKGGMDHLNCVEPVNEEHMIRVINRHRQRKRPQEPKDLTFEVRFVWYIQSVNI